MARKYYDILQINPGASVEEIQHAYRTLALRYHPDQNPAPGAAQAMAAINEAYQEAYAALHPDSSRDAREGVRHSYRAPGAESPFGDAIFEAARAVIYRHGWRLVHEEEPGALFEFGKPPFQIGLVHQLNNESLCRLVRKHRQIGAVLAVRIEAGLTVGPGRIVIDLMTAEQHGASIPEGPCKSLLCGFL